ncbi:PhzF family phenazine biosynthesis protein [Allosediminivita pacifica]|uniref:Trans-2,3-dihydro-3-hydroxyanthranilate isomerase n=1 Tax=Allosediminivita pacifica TaxID=1267769 RepID=A0A2T6BA98_9RHOB|nr:PhzF family phenazine biosynthesis protein [Allosediminivita pacifica]PTX53010.1 trans-2,3-dihydro-3-hydroxyanthranilate isomerase [Allosediminivita pacifica]GGA93785.1 isomerase [Allosediminivita pacifica]
MMQMVVFLSETLPFTVWDVFTDVPYSGNPLAIIEGAGALSDAAMQAMARQFNLSETIFVMPPESEDPAHTAKVRIFTPNAELPFAGHPTVGCAIHLALAACPKRDFETTLTLEEVAGDVQVTVTRRDDMVAAEFRAPVLPFTPETGKAPDAATAAAALGLTPAQVALEGHAPALRQGGPGFIYIPVVDVDALRAARPTGVAWQEMCEAAGLGSVYVYTRAAVTDYAARMFAPGEGIPEDPATGSASAVFAAQLLAAGALEEGETALTLAQGTDMGRPSAIGLRVTVTDGAIEAIYVSGSAVPVSRGEIMRPDL